MSYDTENLDSQENEYENTCSEQEMYEHSQENRPLSFLRESLLTDDVLSQL